MNVQRITWDGGTAEVQMRGGMLGPVWFKLANDKTIQPFAVAPWSDDQGDAYDALPPLLKRLRGEWPCVPFGAPQAPEGLPQHWQPNRSNPVDTEFHGYSSHAVWTVTGQEPGSLTIECPYPKEHAIKSLRRRIEGIPGTTTLKISLTIEARSAVSTTLALHPVFRLSEKAGATRLNPGAFTKGLVFPVEVEPGVSLLSPDTTFEKLEAVPSKSGFLNLGQLPLANDTEELVQLLNAPGQATLTLPDEGYSVSLHYDAEVFPSLLLWISNRGRTAYPWNGGFVALGIEPVRGAFDLGPDVGSDPSNPIAAAGVPTSLSLEAGEVFETTYEIVVNAMSSGGTE